MRIVKINNDGGGKFGGNWKFHCFFSSPMSQKNQTLAITTGRHAQVAKLNPKEG